MSFMPELQLGLLTFLPPCSVVENVVRTYGLAAALTGGEDSYVHVASWSVGFLSQ